MVVEVDQELKGLNERTPKWSSQCTRHFSLIGNIIPDVSGPMLQGATSAYNEDSTCPQRPVGPLGAPDVAEARQSLPNRQHADHNKP
jgi:hypothetical protein